VGAAEGPALHDLVPLGDHVIARIDPVGKGALEVGDHLLMALKVDRHAGTMKDVIGGEELADLPRIPLVPDLLLEGPHDCLVRLGRHVTSSSTIGNIRGLPKVTETRSQTRRRPPLACFS
jgi:hypothetical protein